MYKGKRILVVVPARGGSKGVHLKNLRTINGKPLVGIVGEVVKEIGMIDRAVVSTDSVDIANVAEKYGLEVPFYRPESISGDYIGDIDVLTHALLETEKHDTQKYDIIVMLQPTSPLRTPEHVIDTIRKLVDDSFEAVWTVSKNDSKNHPLKQLTFDNNKLQFYDKNGVNIIARQELSPLYYRNGAAYAITRNCLLEEKQLMSKRTSAVLTEGYMVSIDTEWDIELVEYIMNKRKNK